jgi:hypothetical protein
MAYSALGRLINKTKKDGKEVISTFGGGLAAALKIAYIEAVTKEMSREELQTFLFLQKAVILSPSSKIPKVGRAK